MRVQDQPHERMEQLSQWLEEETFRDRCFEEETNERLAHVEILTSCGMVIDHCRYHDELPVRDGDTLHVVVVPINDQETRSESPGAFRVP